MSTPVPPDQPRFSVREALAGGGQFNALSKTLGFQLITVQPGEAIVEMETTEAHFNVLGTVHGGVLCSVADTAMGIAHASTLAEDQTWTTIELKINFLRPVQKDKIRAVGRVVKAGRAISALECDVFDSQSRLVARASSTYMTMPSSDRGVR